MGSDRSYSRRDIGKLALAAVPLARALAAPKINSNFHGVQIGAITYSFNSIANPDAEAIIKAYVEIGLGEAELMSNHCEALAGAPQVMSGGRQMTPEQQQRTDRTAARALASAAHSSKSFGSSAACPLGNQTSPR